MFASWYSASGLKMPKKSGIQGKSGIRGPVVPRWCGQRSNQRSPALLHGPQWHRADGSALLSRDRGRRALSETDWIRGLIGPRALYLVVSCPCLHFAFERVAPTLRISIYLGWIFFYFFTWPQVLYCCGGEGPLQMYVHQKYHFLTLAVFAPLYFLLTVCANQFPAHFLHIFTWSHFHNCPQNTWTASLYISRKTSLVNILYSNQLLIRLFIILDQNASVPVHFPFFDALFSKKLFLDL